MNKSEFSKHIELKNTHTDDDFWSGVQNIVRKNVIPYQYEALNDNIPGASKSYCIENFKKARKVVEALHNGEQAEEYPVDKWCYDESNAQAGAFHGWVFQDSDAYKWLEAAAYSLSLEWDDELYERANEVIELICSAQMDNGYLDTLYIINNRGKIFSNLRDFHELYCFGHLAEAGVAYYNSTGNDKLLKATMRFADLICETFGENAKQGYGGHEIVELAMTKLYETTGNERYKKAAELFIDRRGTKPYYFDLERGENTEGLGYFYNQAHLPVRQQKEAVGHAVRGVYLYSGMTDLARLNEDDDLYRACCDIWENITQKKMYITGGIGSTVDGEAFSYNYDLPNDLAYCETCASIGLIFFGRRMLEIAPNSQVADTIERALYNTVLAGMNEDGDRFFYVNPLEALPEASRCDSRKKHIKTVRQKWFGCACCPPNLARLICSLGEYCITQNESKVFVHQYVGGEYKTDFGKMKMESDYATSGNVKLSIECKKPFTLAMRIPAWCENYSMSKKASILDGYAYFDIEADCEIELSFELKARLVKCSNLVRENTDKLALCYGPSVYCLEAVDNGENLQLLKLDSKTEFEIDFASPMKTIKAKGFREKADSVLYSSYSQSEKTPCTMTFIPYRLWANRGETEMSVYFRYE